MFVDKRFDSFYDMTTYAATNANLSSYSLTNLFYSTQFINDKLTFKAAVTNIFNEIYTENIGYSTLGRNFLLGFNFMF
jgi:vitamin B12 transporter